MENNKKDWKCWIRRLRIKDKTLNYSQLNSTPNPMKYLLKQINPCKKSNNLWKTAIPMNQIES